MRDNEKNEIYFKEFLNKWENRMNELKIKLHDSETMNEQSLDFLHGRLFHIELEYLIAQFSSGASQEVLNASFQNLLNTCSKVDNVMYEDLLKILSLGVILDENPCEIIAEHLELEIDVFLCIFTNYFEYCVKTEIEPELYPPYDILYNALSKIDTHSIDIENTFFEYLTKEWYDGHMESYWYENLDNPLDVYFGYWSFEVMALAKIYEVDTTRLVKSDYFALL